MKRGDKGAKANKHDVNSDASTGLSDSDMPDSDFSNAGFFNYSGLKKVVQTPVFKSVALHSAILLSLLVSFNFSAKPLQFVSPESSAALPQPEIVKATFIDSNVIEQQKREVAQAEAAARQRQQNIQREEAKRQEALRKKQVDEARVKRETQEKEQQERKEREQEKERAAEQQRIKQAQEKAAQEKAAKEEAQRQQRQEELDKALAQQLEQEQVRMSQANQRRLLSEVDKYKALVQSKVQQFLETDGGFIGETCLVNVRLAPDGLVLRAEAVSGKPALCRIAKAAILRAGTLPMSRDPEVMAQFRQFDIEVSPER